MSNNKPIGVIKCNESSMYFSESHNYNCLFNTKLFLKEEYGNVR